MYKNRMNDRNCFEGFPHTFCAIKCVDDFGNVPSITRLKLYYHDAVTRVGEHNRVVRLITRLIMIRIAAV